MTNRFPTSKNSNSRQREGAFSTSDFITWPIVAETLGLAHRERFEALRADHEEAIPTTGTGARARSSLIDPRASKTCRALPSCDNPSRRMSHWPARMPGFSIKWYVIVETRSVPATHETNSTRN